MGTHTEKVESKTGPKHGASADDAAIVRTSPVGTPKVVDLFNDQIPPGGS